MAKANKVYNVDKKFKVNDCNTNTTVKITSVYQIVGEKIEV